MKLDDWLSLATAKLQSAGVGTARLDALVLLEDATGKNRAWLLAHSSQTLSSSLLTKLERKLERRARHEPLAYIRGKTEFYGREFIINPHVLEPRPESETMIDLLKELLKPKANVKNQGLQIADIGTGSGALAVTAKLELPKAEVMATDIDSKCLKVARQNTRKHKVEIKFYQGNLMQPISSILHSPFSVLICNLPYVPNEFRLNQAAMNEPKQAIFGGPDGLDLYRELFDQIKNAKLKPDFMLTESLPFQHKELEKIALSAAYKLKLSEDFIQAFGVKF